MMLSTLPLAMRRIRGYLTPAMPIRPFRVGRGSSGLGLFATSRIEKGAVIVVYRGRRLTHAQAQARERAGAKYIFELNSRWSIDGSSRKNLARYVNHACKPNAEAVMRKGRIAYVARRAIRPDEEITADYGKEYFDLFIRGRGCRCAKCG
jgi:SET domain-containing protein